MLQTPLDVVKKTFKQKELECVFSLIMAIIVLCISALDAASASKTITNTIIALIVWAVGRGLFELSKKRKMNAPSESNDVNDKDTSDKIELPKKKFPSQKWMEWAKKEEKEKMQE